MTQWYQVLQRTDGRYDYTVKTNSTPAHPLGYCAGWREDTAEALIERFGPGLAEAVLKEQEARRPLRDKYHTGGHATAEEADACYRDYQLDTMLSFEDDKLTQRHCATCAAWTTGYGEVRGDLCERRPLCPTHQTREDMRKALEKPAR